MIRKNSKKFRVSIFTLKKIKGFYHVYNRKTGETIYSCGKQRSILRAKQKLNDHIANNSRKMTIKLKTNSSRAKRTSKRNK